jgi:hypothetical protein
VIGRVILAILAPVLFFALLEGATRVLWHYDLPDPHVGVVLQGTNRQVTHEGTTYTTNAEGIRYPDVDQNKAPGGRRILALGDSFVWGDGLRDDELVTTKLEAALSSEFPGIMVINAGIGGYNTADEYQQLLRLAPRYEPDHVIVFFFTNDILSRESERGSDKRTTSWQQDVKEYLRAHSRFFAWLYYQFKTRYAAQVGVPRQLLSPDYFNLNDTNAGWVSFQKAVTDIRDYCAERGITLQFVMIPTLTGLNERYPFAHMRRSVTEFVTRSNVPVIDLFDVFSPYPPAKLWINPENTHWNDTATTLAAGEIARRLREGGYLR